MVMAIKRVDNVFFLPTSRRHAEIDASTSDSFEITSEERLQQPGSPLPTEHLLTRDRSHIFKAIADKKDEFSARRARAKFIQLRDETYTTIDTHDELPTPYLRTRLLKKLRFFIRGTTSPDRDVRIDSLSLTTQIVESLIKQGRSNTIDDNVGKIKDSAVNLLDDPSSRKVHPDAAIALQRIIPALEGHDKHEALGEVFDAYAGLVDHMDSGTNIAVLNAIVALMKIIPTAVEYNHQTMQIKLAEISRQGSSDEVKALAHKAYEALTSKLPINLIAGYTSAINSLPPTPVR